MNPYTLTHRLVLVTLAALASAGTFAALVLAPMAAGGVA